MNEVEKEFIALQREIKEALREQGQLLQSHALLLQAIASTPSLQQQIAERYSALLTEREQQTGLRLPVVPVA